MLRPTRIALAAGLALTLAAAAGCAATMRQPGAPDGARELARASASIAGKGGITGNATLIEFENDTGRALRVIIDVKGDPAVLTPGLHGVHFHETGECGANFVAAGGHFDPGPHGESAIDKNHPWHMGDLPNLTVDDRGHGKLDAVITSATISDGPLTLFDADGSAIIIHEQEDKRTAKAAGGARIACGVLRR